MNLCSSDSEDYSLTTEDVQGVWKDWLQQLPKENIKIMSIMLTDTFIYQFVLQEDDLGRTWD